MCLNFNVCENVNYGRVKPTYISITDLIDGSIYEITNATTGKTQEYLFIGYKNRYYGPKQYSKKEDTDPQYITTLDPHDITRAIFFNREAAKNVKIDNNGVFSAIDFYDKYDPAYSNYYGRRINSERKINMDLPQQKFKKIHDTTLENEFYLYRGKAYLISYNKTYYYKDTGNDLIQKFHDEDKDITIKELKNFNAIKKTIIKSGIDINDKDMLDAFYLIYNNLDHPDINGITIENINTNFIKNTNLGDEEKHNAIEFFTYKNGSRINSVTNGIDFDYNIDALNSYNSIRKEFEKYELGEITTEALVKYTTIKSFVYETSQPKWEFDKTLFFIDKQGILLRIMTLYFVEFILSEMDISNKTPENTNELLRPFINNSNNSFMANRLLYLNPLQIRYKNKQGLPPPKTASYSLKTASYSINKLFGQLYENKSNNPTYSYTLNNNNPTFVFNDKYQEIETILKDTIYNFLSKTYDKTYGTTTYDGINTVYTTVIITLAKFINPTTTIVDKVRSALTRNSNNTKMYKFASDYLRSQFSLFLYKNYISLKVNPNNNNVTKGFDYMEYGILLMVISKILMSCGDAIVSASTHNFLRLATAASCAVPITILLSLYSIFKTYKLLITKKYLMNQLNKAQNYLTNTNNNSTQSDSINEDNPNDNPDNNKNLIVDINTASELKNIEEDLGTQIEQIRLSEKSNSSDSEKSNSSDSEKSNSSDSEKSNSSSKPAPSIEAIRKTKPGFFRSVSGLIVKKATYDNAKMTVNEIKDLTVDQVAKHVTKAFDINDYINSSKSITSFLMKEMFNTPDLPENHIILSAFSHAFWNAMNPGGSKRPLFIMYKELCTYQNTLA